MASMVDCKKIQGQLSEYIDNEIDADSAWEIRLHLASCAVCARAHHELSAMVSLVQALPARDTSAGFEAALARRLADQALRPRRQTPWGWIQERVQPARSAPYRRAALAAAGALAVLTPAAILLVSGHRPTVQPKPVSQAAPEDQQFVDAVLEEHASFAGAIPLGDEAAALLSTSGDKSARN